MILIGELCSADGLGGLDSGSMVSPKDAAKADINASGRGKQVLHRAALRKGSIFASLGSYVRLQALCSEDQPQPKGDMNAQEILPGMESPCYFLWEI